MENGEFNEEERPSEVRKPSRLKYVIEGLIYIALIVVCVYVVPKYVIQRTVVSGESMEDTLHDAESLLIDKISYRFTDPKRYDIIVFYPKGRDVDEYYVKRNGEKIDDPYAKDSMSTGGIANEPYTLGKDEYFVLGGHRSVSQDSRFTPETSNDKNAPGPVKFENISGKVILRIWPLSKFGVP